MGVRPGRQPGPAVLSPASRVTLHRRGERSHTSGMATYTVTLSEFSSDAFDVQIVGNDGVRQTMLGFKTKADAEAWIVDDARTTASGGSRGFRMRWF
jgi:hypothetical protein